MAVWTLQQGVGLIAFLIFGGASGFGLPVVVGGLVLTVIAAAVRWHRFSWSLTPAGLVIEQGLLQRSRRVVPADRVQSVDLIKPLRHRLLGVVQVRVEAIGGGDTEGQLEAVDLRTALWVQHTLIGARAAARAPDAEVGPHPSPTDGGGPAHGIPPEPGGQGRAATPVAPGPHDTVAVGPRLLARVTPRSLVIAGLTGGRVGVAAVILGGLQQVFGDRVDRFADVLPSDVGLLTGLLLAAGAVLAVFAISIAATVVSYWDFTVSRDAEELRISRGLLEQRLETVPIRRIQSLRIEQNLLRRAAGLASVSADLAGRAGGGDSTSGLLLPIAPVAEAERLVADLLGTAGPVEAPLHPAPERSRRRHLTRGVAAGVAAGVLAAPAVLVGAPTWLPVLVGGLVMAVAVPVALVGWRAIGRTTTEGVLVARTGALVRRRVHVPVARVQGITLHASPFQRRLGLADVSIDIARSRGWAGPRMLEVDHDEALLLAARTVEDAVAASRRRRRP